METIKGTYFEYLLHVCSINVFWMYYIRHIVIYQHQSSFINPLPWPHRTVKSPSYAHDRINKARSSRSQIKCVLLVCLQKHDQLLHTLWRTTVPTIPPRSRQVELGKVEGFWSTLRLLKQTLAEYLNVELRAHWLLMWKETNQLHHVINDVITSDWVRTCRSASSSV